MELRRILSEEFVKAERCAYGPNGFMNMIDKIRYIAKNYGYDAQSNQLVEECAELIQAVNKYRRARGKGQATKETEQMALYNLIEEIADVEIMLEQMKYLLACEERVQYNKELKLERQMERIRNGD